MGEGPLIFQHLRFGMEVRNPSKKLSRLGAALDTNPCFGCVAKLTNLHVQAFGGILIEKRGIDREGVYCGPTPSAVEGWAGGPGGEM